MLSTPRPCDQQIQFFRRYCARRRPGNSSMLEPQRRMALRRRNKLLFGAGRGEKQAMGGATLRLFCRIDLGSVEPTFVRRARLHSHGRISFAGPSCLSRKRGGMIVGCRTNRLRKGAAPYVTSEGGGEMASQKCKRMGFMPWSSFPLADSVYRKRNSGKTQKTGICAGWARV